MMLEIMPPFWNYVADSNYDTVSLIKISES